MELAPCNDLSRQMLVSTLDKISNDAKQAEYIVKLFPNVLPDVARSLVDQATRFARQPNNEDPAEAIRQQLKPFFTFGFLLGKAPQITSLMYTYFEQSSFQPLPEEFFKLTETPDGSNLVLYTYAAFSDDLVRDILKTYTKYLIFNPKLFGSVWNWSELGRIIATHPNRDLKYLAACNLSIITRPTRHQHISMLRNIIDDKNLLIDLQIRYCNIYDNVFTPLIESNPEKREQIMDAYGGRSQTGYSFDSQTLTNVVNILLVKHDISVSPDFKASLSDIERKIEQTVQRYAPVATLDDAISRIAYAASINKPCLIRGPPGCGKTSMIDYIAAQTNRICPPVYIKVQVGDQIDSKLLVGSYVCTEIPGQFEWQPGPLTQAMAYGSWIVFEDIDSAPSEMAQVIHSVIENGNLSCVSCCPIKMDSPHPDFRIFFTQRTYDKSKALKLGFGFVERLCDIVDIPQLTQQDLNKIINRRYKFVCRNNDLIDKILNTYEVVEKIVSETNIFRAPRLVTLRDLFKFCDRVMARNIQQSPDGKYSQLDLDAIVSDAMDCFISFLPETFRLVSARTIGQIFNKPTADIDSFFLQRKPEIRVDSKSIVVGRARLEISGSSTRVVRASMANTRQSLQILESVALCVKNREPVLLVGETGVGKTTIVQYLATLMKTSMVVLNLSQQSDSTDLLGGYRPVEMREIIAPINEKFNTLFMQTYDQNENQQFLQTAEERFLTAKKCSEWLVYLKTIQAICNRALERATNNKDHYYRWSDLSNRVRRLSKRMSEENTSPMALAFAEGTLIRALRRGSWVLLDEINLAEPEVLQCLLLILDSINDSHLYLQGADYNNDGAIRIHPNFRIFACMNPATDIGKRDLPASSRARFTEFFVDDVLEKHELRLIVESYVKTCLKTNQIETIVDFYQGVRSSSTSLSDVSGNSPVFSLRTLCRALTICAQNVCRDMERSLLESLIVTFLQQLNEESVTQVLKLLESTVFKKDKLSKLTENQIQMPQDNHEYVQIEGFWIQTSSQRKFVDESYILTGSVRENLKRICRIIALGQRKLPILIQGNTSVGKTSLIKYLAQMTGNFCYRINNHEHTDLQDYVGRYVLRENGELQFQDGLLVTAMRKGYWVILDELNLAPSELLEALNRVLDDNRELFIPETREVIRAHSKFMLFATQNPPEEYAGRKMLSRAFRNRFIEINFDEIPHLELEIILHRRCRLPPQYAKKIVTVMRELQMLRRESGCFSGKSGFMTMRDLFRWGERYSAFKDTIPDDKTLDWEEYLAGEGLILLEGRARTLNEAGTIKSIIEKVFKRTLDRTKIYSYNLPKQISLEPKFKHIDMTAEYRRIFVQLSQALKYNEPVLLCGQTGCGKTTACQIYAKILGQKLITYNCHLNTESSDFIGNVRPTRQDDGQSNSVQKFPWVDGPLIRAMRKGYIFLMDEISLADDAVLERVNSVLETERSITLTEKNGEEIIAHKSFRFIATMNPGGDYGKKELSPALRNRFTEIYCHNPKDVKQIMAVVEKRLGPNLLKPKIAPKLMEILKRFLSDYYREQSMISIRDVLSWIDFMNRSTSPTQIIPLSIQQAIIDGAKLVFFDQFGTCGHKAAHSDSLELKSRLTSKIERLVESRFGTVSVYTEKLTFNSIREGEYLKISNYCLRKGPVPVPKDIAFVSEAPIVVSNALKLMRALQLERPILLEGDPGVGKTSIVAALARRSGNKLVRINLSEQTDISDLFGSDLPDVSNLNDESPKFCWHDGPLLNAIKNSSWVLLDEMNLASQSVLEGLNACFDHRGEIFIPELNKNFSVDRSMTRIFACQNPYDQGAARKGLPQSFLNRFTSIYIESHTPNDLGIILKNLYPQVPDDMIKKMIEFNNELNTQYSMQGYEFNLRDMIYWCDLITMYVQGDQFKNADLYEPDRFVQFVYLDRLRSVDEKNQISDLFDSIFGYPVYEPPYRELKLGEYSLIFSRSILPRKNRLPPHLSNLCILKYQMPFLESIAKAIESNKMPILVGDFGTGKRSMIQILAGLTGNGLSVVAANREMDVVELLGSFEQKSLQREIVDLVQEANVFVTSLINTNPHCASDESWTQLYKHIWSTLYATSLRDLRLSRNEMMEAYRFQLNQMEELINQLKPLTCVVADKDLRRLVLLKNIKILSNKLLFNSESTYSSGNFEWIDSVLVKSIREGRWLMIENANLMNPATLDRLNSLVEPNGSLSLNEKGSGNDGLEVLKPHPNFRLILTMNPEHGELSRAMRNRGVEIYVRPRFYFEDFLMLLKQHGFKPTENTSCLSYCIMQTCYDTHLKITNEEAEQDGSLLAYFGLNYLSILAQQIRRGILVDDILADLLIAYYLRKGYLENEANDEVRTFVFSRMSEYKKKYVVDLNDDRYKWSLFMHDLVSMSGGDATSAMLVRENKLFWDTTDPISSGLLRPDEIVDSLDIVNTCTTVKIFMELATQGDFEYRKGFIKDTFTNFPKLTDIVNRYVDVLHQECMPLINNQMPESAIIPKTEMYVDTRNSPDMHYYLQAIDLVGTLEREDMQNRWILSLHRSTIETIIRLIEDRSCETSGQTNLWSLAEKVRTGQVLKEDLIRPQATIALDLHDFLLGILRVIGDRCIPNDLVPKMISRLFWIGYFLCKLKRGYNKVELVAVCNQLPMLWALTYQKVVVPIITDCELADITYNNRKFSDRVKQICEFLDVNITKPGHNEKENYNKIINLHAATAKRCEVIGREVDKFFSLLVARCTLKSQSLSLGTELMDVLAVSGLNWTNSAYLTSLYRIEDMMSIMDTKDDDFDANDRARMVFNEARRVLHDKRAEHTAHEESLKKDDYRTKMVGINRKRSALDQFAPVWQVKFLQLRLSLINLEDPKSLVIYRDLLFKMLNCVNGIMMSPRYYGTLLKLFRSVENILSERNTVLVTADLSLNNDTSICDENKKLARQHMNMYGAFLVDHIMENIVLDNQVVGWTKLRVTTSDLASSAPYIPEHAHIISLVSSYCLDITHLKLNSYQNPSPQLDSILIYLWRGYALIKNNPLEDLQDVALVKNFIHARCNASDNQSEIIGDHQCIGPSVNCICTEKYIDRNGPKYSDIVKVINDNADLGDAPIFEKAVKLIFAGFYTMLEFAPIFTLDPSLRSREKLEVYNSELAHIKLDLYQRNTLYYWKTGENLRLVDISPDESKLYPFSIRILIERRCKLEKSIKKLRKEYTNRPRSDDGTMYYELRKEVEVTINRYTKIVEALVVDIVGYLRTKNQTLRAKRLMQLNTKSRMLIKSIETTISKLKSDFVLYSDLTTFYLVGLSFMLLGMRRLYSRLEPKMQLYESGFKHAMVNKFSTDVMRVFSFNDIALNNLQSVANKKAIYTILGRICANEKVSHVQSLLLRSILIQLNHHITLTPSDIERCIPIVHNVADKFHKSWTERKTYLEEQRRKQEELYQYRAPTVTLGRNEDIDRATFIEISKKFPLYDHVYQDEMPSKAERLSAEEENLATEAKIHNLDRSVDLTMCIDVCKAHYKFMKQASLSLLGHQNSSCCNLASKIDINQLNKLQAEILYNIMRQCAPNFDKSFDSLSLECHLLQANELIKLLAREQPKSVRLGSVNSSMEILDECVFDIYHDADVREALRLQVFMTKVDSRVNELRLLKTYEAHPLLNPITRLTTKISSFLITDPLMKFVTGAHLLLQVMEDWNKSVTYSRDHKLTKECDELIDIIKSWREIEVESWRNCLHRVKKKYIDESLCDLWFQLYEAFRDPVAFTKKALIEAGHMEEDEELSPTDERFYLGFMIIIKQYFEEATAGDHQIRLDLVFSFAIQTRFASLFEQAKSANVVLDVGKDNDHKPEANLKIDHEKLTIYVYNMYRQYQGLMSPYRKMLEKAEKEFESELSKQIRFVNWQGGNAWEIKNNFRISHKKLNDCMNQYLKVLRESDISSAFVDKFHAQSELRADPLSKLLHDRYDATKRAVNSIACPNQDSNYVRLTSLNTNSARRMIDLSNTIFDVASKRYTTILGALEESIEHNEASIESFNSHDVQNLVIFQQDTKEERCRKIKICKQIHHNKRYALQSIFKNLQELGSSFQRGNSNIQHNDRAILSLEPLGGMIQNRCQSTMAATSKLVDESLVETCADLYQQMVSRTLSLYEHLTAESQVSSDYTERMLGYAADYQMDICIQSRSAAVIYRHIIDLQASTMRLQQLKEQYKDCNRIVIYNFAKVHQAIQSFDELVGRTMSAFSRLDSLLDCHRTYMRLWSYKDPASYASFAAEREALKDLVGEIDEKNALMTQAQSEHIEKNLDNVRQAVADIGSMLRDQLKHTMQNHLYDIHDIEQLKALCSNFIGSFERLFIDGQEKHPNTKKGTVLGSLKGLLLEAKTSLRPLLDNLEENDSSEVDSIPSVEKLNIRLHKLIKNLKLAVQDIYFEENNFTKLQITSESDRRKMKPFNHISSSKIRDLLRPSQLAAKVANCFATLNMQASCNIEPIVTTLAPMMFIYTQNLACYLNVILSSIHLKLVSACQLNSFFQNVSKKGFELPYSESDLDTLSDVKSDAKTSEDNAGFGDGGQGETDASNKIEYESQLDEMEKGDKDEMNGEQNGSEKGDKVDDEQIKASDNGIEMTDDLDAKPQSPEQGMNDDNFNPEEENPDDEDLLNELDNQFDRVDEAEDHLDQQLWDDNESKDENNLGEDDESDLREADAGKSNPPMMDEIDLMAKSEHLDNSDTKSEAKQQNEVPIKDEDQRNSNENDENDDGDQDGVEFISDINEENFKDLLEQSTGINESVQMDDITDVENKDAEDDSSPEIQEITLNSDGEEDSSDQANEDDKMGESIDLMHEDISEEIPTQDDEMICDDDDVERRGGPGASDLNKEDQTKDKQSKQDRQHRADADSGDADEAEDFEDPAEMVKQGASGEQLGEDKVDEEGAPIPESSDDKSAKRTFAQRTSIEETTTKKQKIEPVESAKDTSKPKAGEIAKSDTVRHIEQDNESAIEVIDIADESDEDLLIDANVELERYQDNPKPTNNGDPLAANDFSPESTSDDDRNVGRLKVDSYFNTNLGLLKYISHGQDKKDKNADESILKQIDEELSSKKSLSAEHESIEMDKLTKLWSECTRNTSHLIHELCQQLQIVLQPTKMSKYRGDYKTGKRLNMRKIISYIASHYRKDKIWLRRTKPSKRTYNISLAVDNSSSMSENNCRSMTYQSLALLAHSLSLIEAGSLSVVKFGEQVRCIHDFGQPYMDAIGAQWLKELRFDEKRTSYSDLLKFSCEEFTKQAQKTMSQVDIQCVNSVHQLLILISDGRNVTSEEDAVKSCLRELKSLGVLTLFIIIDDLKQNSGKSIVDVKSCVQLEGSSGVQIQNYMDVFPFPFYVILHQIETMPSILGDALRQWFELISNAR